MSAADVMHMADSPGRLSAAEAESAMYNILYQTAKVQTTQHRKKAEEIREGLVRFAAEKGDKVLDMANPAFQTIQKQILAHIQAEDAEWEAALRSVLTWLNWREFQKIPGLPTAADLDAEFGKYASLGHAYCAFMEKRLTAKERPVPESMRHLSRCLRTAADRRSTTDATVKACLALYTPLRQRQMAAAVSWILETLGDELRAHPSGRFNEEAARSVYGEYADLARLLAMKLGA
jgi:hypothetical protein